MFVQKSNKYVLVNREPLEPLLIYSLNVKQKQNIISKLFID